MRRCASRVRSSRAGLAAPMSRPRYTSAESTLTISTGAASARWMAQSLLPVPVGPVSRYTGSCDLAFILAIASPRDPHNSPPPQEELVELSEGEARPGRAAVVALV